MAKSNKKTAQPSTNAPQQTKPQATETSLSVPPLWTEKLTDTRVLGISVGIIALISLLVFKDFLLQKYIYLFQDAGGDDVATFYPNLLNIHRNSSWSGGLPGWSFTQGVGQNIYPMSFDFFKIFIYLFFPNNLEGGIIYAEVLKILLAGLFFGLFLRETGASKLACIVSPIGLAFCSYMILGGQWHIFSNEIVFTTLLLWALERFLNRGVWLLIPIPFALYAIEQPFFAYVNSVLTLVYVVVRTFEASKNVLPILTKRLLIIAGCGLLGFGLAMFMLPANIDQLLNSPRVLGGVSLAAELRANPVFELYDNLYLTEVMRLFSTDLIGGGDNYKGFINYLEAPMYYSGLICLVLAPQAFVFMSNRQRKIYGIAIFLVFIPLVFAYFRLAFWLFTGEYFRTYSFFITLILLSFQAKAISGIIENRRISLPILGGTMVVLMFMLFSPFYDRPEIIVTPLRKVIVFLLFVYAGMAWLLSKNATRNIATGLLMILLVGETVYLTNFTVNKRKKVSKLMQTEKEGGFFNNSNLDAVNYLKATDPSFYRISQREGTGLNDAKVQNYRGVTSYSSFNQIGYIKFLYSVGVLEKGGDERSTRWCEGVSGKPALENILNVKYFLAQKFDRATMDALGYDSLRAFGKTKIYQSRFALPFGFCYDQYLSNADLAKLPNHARQAALLEAVAIDTEQMERFKAYARRNIATIDTSIMAFNLNTWAVSVAKLKENTLKLSSFDENNFRGTIALKQPKILFLSIPYDKGWHATVNGQATILEVLDSGFMGLPLAQGNHEIVLHFEPPYLKTGLLLSLISAFIYAFLVWKFRAKTVSNLSADAS